MIVYNNRYRGPYEYEKFLLNILNIHNVVEKLSSFEVIGAEQEINSIKTLQEETDKMFQDFIAGKDSIQEKAFLLSIKKRKEINL